ncbi:hypothetical protein R1flu_018104 [Riccia fluitans]|uniref:Exonuclease domain-containing protein n=1 Tax=Riccia fluitans TaxID=41844 RepID=A0ABD1ZG92_9MARC
MAIPAKFSLLCPCLSLSRWLPTVCSISSPRWIQPQLQCLPAPSSIINPTSTSSSNRNGAEVARLTNESRNVASAWRNSFHLSALGVRLERHEGSVKRAIDKARVSFSTKCCALDKVAEEGYGEPPDSTLDRGALWTGLISPTVPELAVAELPQIPPQAAAERKWSRKRMCYYFSQGLCTLMEDEVHLSNFSHEYPDMSVRADDTEKVKPQPFDHFLVLDLEGRVEILEFPVVMLDAKTLEVVDRFHRFVRPCKMNEEWIEDYIRNKYGKWGLERVWHDTAIPFTQVLPEFESWLESHSLFDTKNPSKLKTAAFVTCGNWDIKTKIPEQCVTSDIQLPPYFNEWINLKDIYFNFYKFRASGMLAMMKGLKMPMQGTHHVGLDDAHNITRVVQRMLAHGVIMQISAKRKAGGGVSFTFRFRIK